MQMSYTHLSLLALPQILVAGTALLVLLVDVGLLRKNSLEKRLGISIGLACFGCMLAAWQTVVSQDHFALADGTFFGSGLTHFAVIGVLGFTIVALLLSVSSRWTEHVGEYVSLVLFATVGMMFLVSTQNLLVLFASLELLSLCLYLLTAFDKHGAVSAEAAMKYFLFGGMSAAFLLFGFSLLYGLSNSTDLTVIGHVVSQRGGSSLLIFAVVTTMIGLGFKVAAAPFHFWVPDVYESAPSPVAAFIASASKLASFLAFYAILTIGFSGFAGSADWFHVREGWVPVVAILAAVSMVVGNLGALAQTSARRLLGYSAIAHSGYMLIAVASHTEKSLVALLYYVLTYGLSTLGAFAVIAVVESETGSDTMSNLDGLSRRMPVLSGCLFVFLLSQAGIPPLAGFFGKFYLFVTAVDGPGGDRGLLWLVVLALGMSAVSLYYYLKVLKRVFVADPAPDAPAMTPSMFTSIVVSLLALTTVIVGCDPSLLLNGIQNAVQQMAR